MKVSESYAQPAPSLGHQARKGAFGVHDRLFIQSPNSCWQAWFAHRRTPVRKPRPRICKDGQ